MLKVSDGLSRAGAKIMLSDFDAVAFTPLSDTYWPSPSLSLQNILWPQVEVWNWGRNILTLQGTQRMQAKNGMGNLGGCMEDVGCWVRWCAYHQHQRQSAEPLHAPTKFR